MLITTIFCSVCSDYSEYTQKILIMTPTSNHPEFIAMQARTFKIFLQDQYEFVVFNDAFDEITAQEIVNVCVKLAIPCVRIPQENRPLGKRFSWATYRHGQALEYMMKTKGFNHNGIVMIIDSDMFLIKKFSVINFLKNHDISGLRLGAVGKENEKTEKNDSKSEFFWPGLMFLNMNNLPHKETMSFLPEETDTQNLDTGGSLHHYLEANPTVRKLFFTQKGRLRLNKNLNPCYFYAPSTRDYLTCSAKCNVTTDSSCNKSSHKQTVLQQLGFSSTTINHILSKKVPPETEFFIEDTFFHSVAGSGHTTVTVNAKMIRKKEQLARGFIKLVTTLPGQ